METLAVPDMKKDLSGTVDLKKKKVGMSRLIPSVERMSRILQELNSARDGARHSASSSHRGELQTDTDAGCTRSHQST